MGRAPAVRAADVTTTPWTDPATSKLHETRARCATAVANANETVQRAQAALVAAQAHLRRAQAAQQEAGEQLRRAGEQLRRLEPARSHNPGFLPHRPAQEHA